MSRACPQLRASEVAREYGRTPRYWIRLAAAGKVPGARQPSGEGGQWAFDAVKLAAWWEAVEREEAAPWRRSTDGARNIGRAPSVKVLPCVGLRARQRTEALLKEVLGDKKPRKPLRAPQRHDVVYAIYSAGHIKFGVSSNVVRRRHSFTTASPAPVVPNRDHSRIEPVGIGNSKAVCQLPRAGGVVQFDARGARFPG